MHPQNVGWSFLLGLNPSHPGVHLIFSAPTPNNLTGGKNHEPPYLLRKTSRPDKLMHLRAETYAIRFRIKLPSKSVNCAAAQRERYHEAAPLLRHYNVAQSGYRKPQKRIRVGFKSSRTRMRMRTGFENQPLCELRFLYMCSVIFHIYIIYL